MVKVEISNGDPFIWTIYDEKESAELFGDDYIEEFGTEIPEELLQEYKKVSAEFWKIQSQIDKIMERK